VRLKRETLVDPEVAEVLQKFQVVEVDVDEHPELARAYSVITVPDVVFIDRAALIVHRFQGFEAPGPFLARLAHVLEKSTGRK
jgi:thioredoxin-like negative regulator of GroEL